MSKYLCLPCGYLYDEESQDKKENNSKIKFEDQPINWTCPDCGSGKHEFDKMEEEENESSKR